MKLYLEMKKKIIASIFVVLMYTFITSFKSSKPNINKVALDLNKSKVEWFAKKVGGKHNGYIAIDSGFLELNDKQLIGGKFFVNTKSMIDTDLKFKKANKWLMGHLKNNFFEVNKYPTASFIITAVNPNGDNYSIDGKMTIKDITKEIKFPATINFTDTAVYANATIKLDRRDFGIIYGKGIIKKMANKAIYNNFNLKISLVAVR